MNPFVRIVYLSEDAATYPLPIETQDHFYILTADSFNKLNQYRLMYSNLGVVIVHFKDASSAKSVGHFWSREFSKGMI